MASEPRLPFAARLAVRILVPSELREEVEGDLAERFAEVRRAEGAPAAHRWLRWQLRSIGPWSLRGRPAGARAVTPSRPASGGGGWSWDLRLGVRALRLRPAASLLVIVTIAVSIGATTSVFTVVHGVLLRPLPFPQPDRLVQVWQTKRSWFDSPNSQLRAFANRFPLSMPTFNDWTGADTGLEAIGALADRTFVLQGAEGAEVLYGQSVTSGYFDALRVEAAVGRRLLPADDPPGAAPVVVLSDRLWEERYGRDPAAIGSSLPLDGIPRTVVGVMPADFRSPVGDGAVWTTFDEEEKTDARDSQYLQVLGRLADGVAIETAMERLETVQASLAQAYPDEQGDVGSRMLPLLDSVVGDVRSTLWFLFGAVGLVLLVATLNIANVLTVTGLTRRREVAVKAALGAGAGRLLRGLFIENAVLAMIGGLAGVVLAWGSLPLLLRVVPPTVPRQDAILMSPGVLVFALLLSVVTTIAVGVVPALQAATTLPQEMMRSATRGATGGRVAGRVRGAMVSAEIAVAFVLLVAAGLLGNSFARLWSVDRGFATEGLVMVSAAPDPAAYPEREDRERFVRELRERLDAIPGVEATAANQVPLSGSMSTTTYHVERPDGREDEETLVVITVTLENYLDVMRIPVLAGRPFDLSDTGDAPPVGIVNESMAEALWPGESPLGKRVRSSPESPWVEVVGLAANVQHQGLDIRAEPKLYVPAAQSGRSTTRWVLRVSGDRAASVELARAAVGALSPTTPVRDVEILDEWISRSVAVPRFRTIFVVALAALAALLALVGVYGVVTFAVAQRTREIGVRMALGADAGGVVRGVVSSGVRLSLLGVAVGLVIALVGADVLSDFLFDVTPTDALTYTSIAVAVTAVSALAAYLPAKRAAAVDPVTVLNSE